MQCRISSRTSNAEDGDAVGDPAMMTYDSGTEEGCRWMKKEVVGPVSTHASLISQ